MSEALSQDAGWTFDHSYVRLPELFYSKVRPTPVCSPRIAVLNDPLARSLGLDPEALRTDEGTAVLAGNAVPPGAEPIAQAYAGHQFGYFTKLGDGRAILLGEQLTPSGERVDIQYKGSGITPYSRRGDGRAALGPMLREYIISEAMHALGIPTTRSLAVVTTGEPVYREEVLRGAVLTRIASSHIRVGTFQYAAAFGTVDDVRGLADYTLQRHYAHADAGDDRYLQLLRLAAERQASLIAGWMRVGFIHGVMNTDNMAVSGETIDYGPCAFIDAYDPATVFSSIDTHGRYAYGNQPLIGAWNLARFAETLLPLLHEDQERAVKLAEEEIARYQQRYQQHWMAAMRGKLGLANEEPEDEALIDDLLQFMKQCEADYTNTFRALTLDQEGDGVLFEMEEYARWHDRWLARRARQPLSPDQSRELMRRSNPAVIPRNHLVEEALEAAVENDDYGVMHRLLAVLSDPYAYTPEQSEYCELPERSSRPYRTFCGT